jgi:hypothetical protein
MGDSSDGCNLALLKHKIHAIVEGKRLRPAGSAVAERKWLGGSRSIRDASSTGERVPSVKRLWVLSVIGGVQSLESFVSLRVYHFSRGCKETVHLNRGFIGADGETQGSLWAETPLPSRRQRDSEKAMKPRTDEVQNRVLLLHEWTVEASESSRQLISDWAYDGVTFRMDLPIEQQGDRL